MKLEYDAISPITGNECVIIEADEKTNLNSYMCMESGYTTTDEFKIGSEYVELYENQITDLMKAVRFQDAELNLIWYPAFLNVPHVGMLYCVGDDQSNMSWEVSAAVEISGEDRKKYPIPNKEGEYFTSRLDVENANKFEKSQFNQALDYFYGLVNEVYAQ